MRSSALLATAGVLALVACTGDDPMILGDTTEGGTAPDDGGGGGGGDSTAPSTPDHRCDQGAPVDTKCQCVPGEQRACNAHAGKDGTTCKAGTQKCVLGSPPSTSAYEACSGAVDPAADDCEADGSDKDCDGVKGNGTTCTQKVYLYATEAYSCAAGSTAWPRDMYMTDAADPGRRAERVRSRRHDEAVRGPAAARRSRCTDASMRRATNTSWAAAAAAPTALVSASSATPRRSMEARDG